MSIIGGSNNPKTLAPVKVHQNFGQEHAVFIRYLHESGCSDAEILERTRTIFADKLVVTSGVSKDRQKKDLKGKVALYTSKHADIEVPESEVSKFAWGSALIEQMARRKSGGNETVETEVVGDLLES